MVPGGRAVILIIVLAVWSAIIALGYVAIRETIRATNKK
jgi:hypothetical protein